jgi:hypothetical protein
LFSPIAIQNDPIDRSSNIESTELPQERSFLDSKTLHLQGGVLSVRDLAASERKLFLLGRCLHGRLDFLEILSEFTIVHRGQNLSRLDLITRRNFRLGEDSIERRDRPSTDKWFNSARRQHGVLHWNVECTYQRQQSQQGYFHACAMQHSLRDLSPPITGAFSVTPRSTKRLLANL